MQWRYSLTTKVAVAAASVAALGSLAGCVRSGFVDWTRIDGSVLPPADGATDAAAGDTTARDATGIDSAGTDTSGQPGTPTTLANLQLANASVNGFAVSIEASGDGEGNGSATVHWCSTSDSAACDPYATAGLTLQRDSTGYRGQVAVAGPDDPGDTLRVRVHASDPDGVNGNDLETTVVLRSTVTVTVPYPANKNWNDYIKNGDSNADAYGQADVACDAVVDRGAGGPDNCLHGGELRQFAIDGLTDCNGYVATDTAGVWNWSCRDNYGTGPVVFRTAGFRSGRGLRDLIDGNGFKPNTVEIVRLVSGLVAANSAPAVWDWANPLLPLPANGTGAVQLLATPSAIHFAATSTTSNGYNLAADKIAIVTLPTVTLSWGDGTADNCNSSSGETAAPDSKSFICAGDQRFLWIETSTRALPTDPLQHQLALNRLVFGRVHLTTADTSSGGDAIDIAETTNSRFTHLTSRSAGGLGLDLWNSSHNVLEGIEIQDSADVGLHVDGVSEWNQIKVVAVQGAGDSAGEGGVELWGPQVAFNKLYKIKVVESRGYGILLYDNAHDNWLIDFESHRNDGGPSELGVGVGVQGPRNKLVVGKVSNNSDWGVRVQYWLGDDSFDTTVVGVLAASNTHVGIFFQSESARSTGLHLTSLVNSDLGFDLLGPDQVVLANALAVANHRSGVGAYGTPSPPPAGDGPIIDNRLFDIMALDNATSDTWPHQLSVYFGAGGGSGNRFDGNLWLGGSGEMCNAGDGGAGGDGLIEDTCTDTGLEGSSIYSGELSTAVLHVGVTASSSFVGKVTGDDLVNSADSNGTAAAAAIRGAAWVQFDNPWRLWGNDGSAFPASDNAGLCQAGSCRIWDWRLRATDTAVRNRHGAFVANAPCPASVHGDQVLDDNQQLDHFAGINAIENGGDSLGDDDGSCEPGERCHNRFLIHAIELTMDDVGDDDGLCESIEICLYAPNVGAYQGTGNHWSNECTFVDGGAAGVSGVKLHAYPVNGG